MSIVAEPPKATAALARVLPSALASPYRLTVDQYHRMIDAGVFDDGRKAERIEGLVIDKMPQNPPHGGTITIVASLLTIRLHPAHAIRPQLPITLSASEPEPDIVVALGPPVRTLSDTQSPGRSRWSSRSPTRRSRSIES